MVFIRGCVHSGLCPFGMVSIRDGAIRDGAIRDGAIRDYIFRDRVQDPFRQC